MSTISNPILSSALTRTEGKRNPKTKTKTKRSASNSVSTRAAMAGAEVNAANKRLNRETTTNTKRAGSSSHKAQNGLLSASAQAALTLKKDKKNLKNKAQRLRRVEHELAELTADVAVRQTTYGSIAMGDSHVIDIDSDNESSSIDAEGAPEQYTYKTARLYTRSAPAIKSRLNIFDMFMIIFVCGCIITSGLDLQYLYLLIPCVLIVACRACLYYLSVARRTVYDPNSLVVDPQNLRPHRDTVVDHSLVGDQMAMIGYTSHSDVTICVEVYDHFLSRKAGMKFSERTFQNLMTEAFYAFSTPPDGVTPISVDVLENTSYVFGQYLVALQMRAKYHLPLTLDAPVPIFQKANWWNIA